MEEETAEPDLLHVLPNGERTSASPPLGQSGLVYIELIKEEPGHTDADQSSLCPDISGHPFQVGQSGRNHQDMALQQNAHFGLDMEIDYVASVEEVSTNSGVKPREARTPTPVNNQSFMCNGRNLQASTELILSNTSASYEHVNQLIRDVSDCQQVTPSPIMVKMKMNSPGGTGCESKEDDQKPNIIRKIIVLRPGDDPEAMTSDAINEITASLNKQAAERMAQGRTPDKETVIEITRIKTTGEGYFDSDSLTEVEPESSEQKKASSPKQLPQQGLSTPKPNKKHHRRKSPHPKKCMYHTPSPPCLKKRTAAQRSHNFSGSCYFQSKPKTSTLTASSQLLGSKQAAAGGETVSQPPASKDVSKLPTILRNSRQQQQQTQQQQQSRALQSLLKHVKSSSAGTSSVEDLCLTKPKAVKAETLPSSTCSQESDSSPESSGEAGKMNDSLTNIQWLGMMSGEKVTIHRDVRVMASEKQLNQISRECGRNKRPPYSYMHLIQMAICSKPDKKMTLKEIYRWIEEKFLYYKHCRNQGWKNSIRHNLSLYDIFVREKPNTPGHNGCSYWTLRPNAQAKTPKPARPLVCDSEKRLGAQDRERRNAAARAAAVANRCESPLTTYDVANASGSFCQNGKKKGPVPLLPKLPPMQTYALIPIQGGVPVLPSQPVMVSPIAANTSVDSQQQQSMMVSMGLSDDRQTPQSHDSSAASDSSHPKPSLKRYHSPTEFTTEVGHRKQVKIAPQIDIYDDSTQTVKHRWTKGSSRSCTITQPNDASDVSGNLGDSVDTSALGKQLSQIRFDSGVVCDLSCGEDSNLSDFPQKGLPKPVMYPQMSSHKALKAGTLLSVSGGSVSDSGLHDILSSIEKSLSSPVRQLLHTPPKPELSPKPKQVFDTSTPFKGAADNPYQWISPIKDLTPITSDGAMIGPIFTPPEQDVKACMSTPYRTETTPVKKEELSEKSPGLGQIYCFQGLTPLKTPFKTPPSLLKSSPKGGSEHSPNDSFGLQNQSLSKFLGEFPLESMIDEGINMDVSNMSFSALQ